MVNAIKAEQIDNYTLTTFDDGTYAVGYSVPIRRGTFRNDVSYFKTLAEAMAFINPEQKPE